MDQPSIPSKPHFQWDSNGHHVEAKNEFAARVYQADAYRERTYEEGKRAHADRLAETRLKSVAMAFDVYKQEPGTFGLSDVFALADRFVEYAREGNQPQDGTAGRFHGK